MKKRKPEIKIHAVVFTPDEVVVLRRLSGAVTDDIGRKISMSAVLRAIVQWMGTRDGKFVRQEIVPVIERELAILSHGRKKE